MSALLIVCVVSFLCPAVGKANVVTVTKEPYCCLEMQACNDARADVASSSMRAPIAAEQVLHGFLFDAQSSLPDLRKFLYPAF